MSGSQSASGYYVPHGSHWPIVGSIALFTLLGGFALSLNGHGIGKTSMVIGVICLLIMLFGWFGTVIRESEAGMYNSQVDVSFRWGMVWFIFSEVMFFAAFFGALYYARNFSVPWLGGEGAKAATHQFLWSDFQNVWPLKSTPNQTMFTQIKEVIGPWGIPALKVHMSWGENERAMIPDLAPASTAMLASVIRSSMSSSATTGPANSRAR